VHIGRRRGGSTTLQQASNINTMQGANNNNAKQGTNNNNTREGEVSTWCGTPTTQGEERATTTTQGKAR